MEKAWASIVGVVGGVSTIAGLLIKLRPFIANALHRLGHERLAKLIAPPDPMKDMEDRLLKALNVDSAKQALLPLPF